MGYRRGLPALLLGCVLAIVACGGGDQSGGSPEGDEQVGTEQSTAVEPAPEFTAIEGWHNAEPLTLAGMQGSTVLLVFFSDT